MSKFATVVTMTAALLLTGAADLLQAQTTTAAELAAVEDNPSDRHEKFIEYLTEQFRLARTHLANINHTQLIVQSVPYVTQLTQFNPAGSNVMLAHNSSQVAKQFQHLIREGKRRELRAFIETVRQMGDQLAQSNPVLRMTGAVTDQMQLLGKLLLSNVQIDRENVHQFLKEFQEFRNTRGTEKVVQQD